MQVLAMVFIMIMTLGLIGIVIALQPDIKRLLEQAGGKDYIKEFFKFIGRDTNSVILFQDKTVDSIVNACSEMQSTKTGALIVLEIDTPLDTITTTGLKLDAIVQKAMIVQSFVKNTPLHDGAMVIKGNKIDSATCYLPLQNNSKISKDLGTRHRAGIGATEEVNCFVIIVSEETGAISWAENGRLRHKVSPKELKQKLTNLQHSKDKTYLEGKNTVEVQSNTQKKIVNKIKRFLAEKVGNNLKDKIIACLCAILVWFTVINFLDPITTRRFQDITVQTINQDILAETDKTFDIIQGQNVQVILKGRRSTLDSLNAEQIKASADFNNMSITYAIPIDIQLPEEYSDSVQLAYIQCDNMRIELDDIAEVILGVEVNQVGNVKNGKYINGIKLDKTQIKVSGPSKLIQTIDRAVLDINVEGADENFQITSTPKVYDRNGQIIQADRVEIDSEKIKQSVQIVDTKEISLNVSLVNKSDDIRIDEYNLSSNTIKVAGSEEYLKELKELNIEVDVTSTLQKAEQSKVVEVIDLDNYVDSNIQIYSDSKINIQMQVQKMVTKCFEIQGESLNIINKDNKYRYEIAPKTLEIALKGYKDKLEQVNIGDIKISIDVKDYGQGDYMEQVAVTLDSQYQDLKVLESPNVLIKVTKTRGD